MQNIEDTLSRELHEVAAGLHVPAMPLLPEEESRDRHLWRPLLAAAVVLIVLGLVAVLSVDRGNQDPDPAPPSPTPTPSETKATEPPVEVSTAAPTVPYVLDDRLYVDGEQVPGTWWYLETAGPTWLATSALDNTWWWGRGSEPRLIETLIESAPVLSPDGTYVAMIDAESGTVTGFDTTFSGEGLMSVPVELTDPGLSVRAVTADGKVIVQGLGTAMLWLPFENNETVDLTETAPGQDVLLNTPAGLVVRDGVDGVDGDKYLAEISEAGELTPLGDLPAHDSLVVSPGAEWMAWTPVGTLGGEVTEVGSLEAGSVDGGQRVTFTSPSGWGFQVQDWVWEDDENLVSAVVKGAAERTARCSVLTQSCVLVDVP